MITAFGPGWPWHWNPFRLVIISAANEFHDCRSCLQILLHVSDVENVKGVPVIELAT